MNNEIIKDGKHKFVWSVPCDSYTLAAVCEYCGLVSFHTNASPEKREQMQQQILHFECPRNKSDSYGNAQQNVNINYL